MPAGRYRQHLTQDVLIRQVNVVGTNNAKLPPAYVYWTRARRILLFLEYLHHGQMGVADLITHRFSPMEAAEVYQMLQQDRASTLGVLFDWREI